MKIFISADIEGICGVTHWDETDLNNPAYQPFRQQMTAEVAAACQGALQAGAREIWVKDAHASGRNLIAADLPQQARLVRGWSGHPFGMLESLDESFQALALIGYHSRAGSGASPLAHTLSGSITTLKINERFASEFLLAAYTAALVKVPLVLVLGDEGLCLEAFEFHPEIRTVVVKTGSGDATASLHPAVAVERIQQGMQRALGEDLSRCLIPLPRHFRCEARFRRHPEAYKASFYPGAQKLDDHTILYENDSYFEILRFLLFTI